MAAESAANVLSVNMRIVLKPLTSSCAELLVEGDGSRRRFLLLVVADSLWRPSISLCSCAVDCEPTMSSELKQDLVALAVGGYSTDRALRCCCRRELEGDRNL